MIELTVAITIRENSQPGALVHQERTETIVPYEHMNDPVRLFGQLEARCEILAEDTTRAAIQQVQIHKGLAESGTHPFQEPPPGYEPS
jgi:hypothetical protein